MAFRDRLGSRDAEEGSQDAARQRSDAEDQARLAAPRLEGAAASNPRVKTAYSFVVTDTFLIDQASDEGRSMVAELHPQVSQLLSQAKPAFKRLYDQVVREDIMSVVGTGMAASPADAWEALLAWLRNKGAVIADVGPLIDEQVFVLAGDAVDARSGSPFKWTVFFYFEFSG